MTPTQARKILAAMRDIDASRPADLTYREVVKMARLFDRATTALEAALEALDDAEQDKRDLEEQVKALEEEAA